MDEVAYAGEVTITSTDNNTNKMIMETMVDTLTTVEEAVVDVATKADEEIDWWR